ncbi:MAG TPA: Xaa-Pro peptidase family protein [Terriglobales bacterium]|nr:Xaa-Pro peptidase family protein [Terriglobales bacterium]
MMDYKARQKKLLVSLGTHSLDAFLITHLPNIRYLCGFTGSAGTLLLTGHSSIFFTDGRYTSQAAEEVADAKVVISHTQTLQCAAEWIARNHKKPGLNSKKAFKLGFEAEHLSSASTQRLRRMLPTGCRLQQTSMLVERIRMVKDVEELKQLRSAVLVGSSLFDITVNRIRAGIKETEVAAELEYDARNAGAEGMSFSTIVASGKRSALPHGVASTAQIPSRGFVVCDFGVILTGYCSDMTRTVHVGRPTKEARHVYEAVLEAQMAAIAAVRSGVSGSDVDRAARNVLKKRGLAAYFTHSTGHGVGLEIHELPRIAAKQAETLRAGMVITIEPGVYIPGKFGVRIEDMVVVTEGGCEVLTPTSKELMIL